ncbi:MAG TPA: hypothetical protein VL093_00410 [Flavipsychrobacter sp.]|nr:hypothetical protein [Flavipsychrobacter sp.]
MNSLDKDIRVRRRIGCLKKVILHESMVFLITASPEKILEILRHKMEVREDERKHFQLIHDYVAGLSDSQGEIVNLESWCRQNEKRLSWKHFLAEALQRSYCEIYYRPLGIYAREIEIETFKIVQQKPGKFSFMMKDTTGFIGRRFCYGNDLIVEVRDKGWL